MDTQRNAGWKVRKARADAHAAGLGPIVAKLKVAGVTSLAGIARAFNERGIPTPTGRGQWSALQIRRVLARLKGTL
jgi:hypothetical protein